MKHKISSKHLKSFMFSMGRPLKPLALHFVLMNLFLPDLALIQVALTDLFYIVLVVNLYLLLNK